MDIVHLMVIFQTFFEYFEDTLSEIDLTKIDLFFMGDFDIDYLDKKSDNTSKFKATLKQYGLDQLILKPTRYSELRES